jgi:hypothetical protein
MSQIRALKIIKIAVIVMPRRLLLIVVPQFQVFLFLFFWWRCLRRGIFLVRTSSFENIIIFKIRFVSTFCFANYRNWVTFLLLSHRFFWWRGIGFTKTNLIIVRIEFIIIKVLFVRVYRFCVFVKHKRWLILACGWALRCHRFTRFLKRILSIFDFWCFLRYSCSWCFWCICLLFCCKWVDIFILLRGFFSCCTWGSNYWFRFLLLFKRVRRGRCLFLLLLLLRNLHLCLYFLFLIFQIF